MPLLYFSAGRRNLLAILAFLLPLALSAQYSEIDPADRDSLEGLLASNQADSTIVKALFDWDDQIYRSDPELDLVLNEAILQIAEHRLKQEIGPEERRFFRKNKMDCLNNLGLTYSSRGNYDLALDYHSQRLMMTREDGDSLGEARSYNNLALVYRHQGQYDTAIHYYSKSLYLKQQAGTPADQMSTLSNMGLVYNFQGNTRLAVEHLERARAIAEAENDSIWMARALGNLGILYRHIKDTATALEQFRDCAEIGRKAHEPALEARALNNIAAIFFDQENWAKALHYDSLALNIRQQIGDRQGIAQSLFNLATIFSEQQANDRALATAREGLAIDREIGNPKGIAAKLTLIAGILLDQGKGPEALKTINEAVAIAEELGDAEELRSAADISWAIHKKLGNYQEALAAYERYIAMEDSLSDEEAQQQVIRREFEYEYEKELSVQRARAEEQQKVTEAELTAERAQGNALLIGLGLTGALLVVLGLFFVRLRKDRKIILGQKSQVETANQKMEVLLKEIHHRVKNNLQVVSGLLQLQSSRSKQVEVKAAMEEGQLRIESMALVHQMLYQDYDFSQLPFSHYLRQLCDQIAQSFPGKQVQIDIESGDLKLEIDDAIPLGLIVNELVTNSYKHAFSGDAGTVTIRVEQTEGEHYRFLYRDNGPGLPKEIEPTKVRSLGLLLVRMLAQEVNGEVSFEPGPGFGVVIER